MSNLTNQITRLQNAKAALKTALEAKGVTVSSDATLDAYPALVDSIPSGGGGSNIPSNFVDFYDYDGTRVCSYSKSDFLALTSLPENPDHTSDGLIAEGWNWTLQQAQDAIRNSKYGLDIGQLYSVAGLNNHIKFYITIPSDNYQFSIWSMVKYGCTATINWGDESESTTMSGTSQTEYTHTYQSGNYVIEIIGSESKCVGLGKNYNSSCFVDSGECVIRAEIGADCYNVGYPYLRELKNLEFVCTLVPDSISSGLLNGCVSLKTLLIGPSVRFDGQNLLNNCVNLKTLIIPYNVTNSNISGYGQFDNCQKLSLVVLPANSYYNVNSSSYSPFKNKNVICRNLNYINVNSSYKFAAFQWYGAPDKLFIQFPMISQACQECVGLQEVTLSNLVTSIPSQAFYDCRSLKTLYILYDEAVVTLSNNVFDNSMLKNIYVPATLVESYKSDSSWSTYASKIQAIPA